MPKFSVEHKTQLPQKETYSKIKDFLQKEDISKLAPGAKLNFSDADNKATLIGPQFKADITIQGSGDQSTVLVQVDLGFLLTPFKGKVEDVLKKQLAKHLG